MTIAFTMQSGSRFWRRHILLLKADLNFRTQTVPRRYYWLQQRDINIRRQVTFEQIITTVEGFSNSCPWMVSVSFHQSCLGFDGMHAIDNASRQVTFEQRIFPRIFISTIRQIFCLTPLLLMHPWYQIVPLWIPFEQSNFSFSLQPHKSTESHWTRLEWSPRFELRLYHLVV